MFKTANGTLALIVRENTDRSSDILLQFAGVWRILGRFWSPYPRKDVLAQREHCEGLKDWTDVQRVIGITELLFIRV